MLCILSLLAFFSMVTQPLLVHFLGKTFWVFVQSVIKLLLTFGWDFWCKFHPLVKWWESHTSPTKLLSSTPSSRRTFLGLRIQHAIHRGTRGHPGVQIAREGYFHGKEVGIACIISQKWWQKIQLLVTLYYWTISSIDFSLYRKNVTFSIYSPI